MRAIRSSAGAGSGDIKTELVRFPAMFKEEWSCFSYNKYLDDLTVHTLGGGRKVPGGDRAFFLLPSFQQKLTILIFRGVLFLFGCIFRCCHNFFVVGIGYNQYNCQQSHQT